MSDTKPSRQLERIPTGVPGLDEILRGGFITGGTYIVQGAPGTGKTILGNQICFDHVRRGGRAVYVTLLAETHARMLAHIGPLAFFEPDSIGESLTYVSAYRELEQAGLSGLLDVLRRVIRERKASLLILDGLVSAEAVSESELQFKKFINELNTLVGYIGCTTFLLTNGTDPTKSHPEHTMVDGLIELADDVVELRAARELVVKKFRGSGYLRGKHIFEIDAQGIRVYPRTEARALAQKGIPGESSQLLPFLVPGLDTMLRGGLNRGSTTLLLGPSGSGKTMLGLHFLAAAAKAKEKSVYFGFFESPPRLQAKGDRIGLNMTKLVDDGMVEMLWQPPVELNIDALAERLLETLRNNGARRLYLDGLVGFKIASLYPARTSRFFAALTNELRSVGVTTVISEETPQLFGPEISVPITGVSALVENIIYMRQVEQRSQLHRLISVLKTREVDHDQSLREFSINAKGVHVEATFEGAERILTGMVQAPASTREPPAKAKAKAKQSPAKARKKPPRRR